MLRTLLQWLRDAGNAGRVSRADSTGESEAMNIFVTADEHYGHRNIITFCKRPFQDVNHMREALIERHNWKVPDSPTSLTIHVGDMFWNSMEEKDCYDILHRLHGKHAFIFGNHDEVIERSPWLKEQFAWIVGKNKASGIEILNYEGTKLVLCHYAMRVWERSHKGSWMCFGHSHDELPVVGKSFDIGVDGHDYFPWSLKEIKAKMDTLEQGHVIKPEDVWPGKETTE
jgi:calcineurin-like phosphoesterase family protein